MLSSVPQFLTLIKFSHTVFALPFALIAAILAINRGSFANPDLQIWEMILWVIIAMVGARSGAMGFNRWVDRKWDAQNPRTADRPSVTGEISSFQMILMIVISYGILIFSAWMLNPIAFYLSPAALFVISFYSYAKRFTSFAHIFLGIAIGAAPIGAWIAITGEVSHSAWLLAGSVLTWIAGFDVLYALQDYEFDKNAGLFSIPVRFGIANSLLIAKLLHVMTVILWILLARSESLNWIFYTGIGICAGLLSWEHNLLRKDDLSKLNMAFFNMNAVISITIFCAVSLDLLLL